MKEKRAVARIPRKLPARFFPEGLKTGKPCTLVELGERGLGVRFHVKEKIDFGRKLFVEVDVPGKDRPVRAEIVVMWKKELFDSSGYIHVIGGEFRNIRESEIAFLRKESAGPKQKENSVILED